MNNTHCRIACVGEAMVELALDPAGTTARVGFAGDTLNTAIYLVREMPGIHNVAFVSAIGTDTMSDRMVDFIEAEGISTDQLLRVDDRLPGIYAINTDDHGERTFAYWRENSAARTLFQKGSGADFSVLEDFDVIYLSAITLAILPPTIRDALFDWIKSFRDNGGLFAFDSNYRPRLWDNEDIARDVVSAAWRLCDIALPSIDDEMALFGDVDEASVLARIDACGVRTGALKRGAKGPIPINAPINPSLVFAPATKVVDTTAAGDSFNGGFLAAFLAGHSLDEAMMAGHNRAALVVGCRGAIAPRDML